MAGDGPAPKDPSTRVRRNAQPDQRIIEVEAGVQPELPSEMPLRQYVDGEVVGFGQPWPAATRNWWEMWATHPLVDEFTQDTWLYLLDTALLHGAYWSGDLKWGPEIRNRVAQFAPTPEARAKLRIAYAVATKSEAEANKQKPPAKKPAAKKRSARSSLYAV